MPRYFFHVRNDSGGFSDLDGTDLPDIPSAMNYARGFARELMLRNESKKRHWHVVPCDADGNELFDLPFISVDETLRHLNPVSRRLIEATCEKKMALAEALFETRMTALRVRATVARSRSRPYLAAEHGHTIFGKAPRKG
jgi:uncharacterized protein DUF6894